MRTLGLFALLSLAGFAADPGPAVGAKAPTFELTDQNGQTRTLQDVMGPKGVMLVFYRSADWWPYCKGQLVELQSNLENIRRQQLGVAAISYDSPAILKHFAERSHITFPLLSDPESKTIRAFGILNEAVKENTPQFGIPHPGTFIVDPSGKVVAKYFEEDFRERYTSSDILIRQFGAGAGASTLTETKHLQLKTSASQSSARMGQRITLVMEVDLKPGMHVYAPGVTGYIPIDWKVTESPAVKIHAVDYPKSELLNLKAIQETVPVYRNHFRLVRDLTVGSDADVRPTLNPSHDLVIAGTLRYQACDEKICYLPENVPLTWTIRYEDLDRERVPVDLRRKAP